MAYFSLIISVVALILAIAALVVRCKDRKSAKTDRVKVVDGVRYSRDGDKFNQGDIILKQNVKYIAKKDTKLLPGKYVVNSTTENDTFSVRLNTFVREYHSGDEIVLAENEEITAVSQSVILR